MFDSNIFKNARLISFGSRSKNALITQTLCLQQILLHYIFTIIMFLLQYVTVVLVIS